MISLDDLKRKVQEIPPLPDIALRLLDMCRDPDVPPRDIVEIIKLDPAITMKVLRLCNSPFYGMPRKVTSLQEAMVYLGTDALVNFVLAGCLSQFYNGENEGYGLDEGELWRHAVGVAICAQRVAERVDHDLSGLAFTCGLLHDIGKIILNSFVAEDFKRLIDLVDREGISFLDAEEKVLGYTHTTAGADIAEGWNLPSEITESIRYHHDPMQAKEHRRLVAIVHVGNILCISFGIGIGSDGLAYVFHPASLELLGISVEDLYALSIEVHDQLKNSEELLNMR